MTQNKQEPEAKLPAVSRAGLFALFWLARHTPGLLRIIKPIAVWLAIRFSSHIRMGTTANGRRILGASVSLKDLSKFIRDVVGNFFDFVADIGRSRAMTREQLRGQIETVEGRDEYLELRKGGVGAIIVTAHIGSFEVGLAALAEVESQVHVVFKRDQIGVFDGIRKDMRTKLGILESPIDDGWDTWVSLRDALTNNHVVVMQGDRAMPGQKSQAVPLLGGHVRLPVGPFKLAQITGSPVVPVFTIRKPNGRCHLIAEPPIWVDSQSRIIDGMHPALLQLASVIAKHIAESPPQWLILGPAFVEDLPAHEKQV
jgi:phosphatidylinositol dimannoside acyltransferase